jgi:tetratricopeptide repeat protein 21B
MAMLSAHKKAKTVDKEAVAALKNKVDESVRSSGPEQLFNAALFLWHDGRHDKARDLTNRLLKDEKASVEGLTARGWVNMTCGRESMSTKAPKDFTDAIEAADAAGSFGAGLMAKIGMIW